MKNQSFQSLYSHALLALTAMALMQSASAATVIPVTNGSFETSLGYNGGDPPTIPGWNLGASFGQVENASAGFTSGLTGSNAIYVGGNIQQNTGAVFVAGETYTLSLDVGQPTFSTGGAGFLFGFRTATNSAFITGGSGFDGGGSTLGTFRNTTFSYTAVASDAGNPVIIGIDDFFTGTGNNQFLDNVTLTTTVPEPSSYLLFGFAGLGLLSRRSRSSTV